MDAPINDYRDIEVWKQGMSLAVDVYRKTASFPREEQYGLTSQMRRAASSVPANIAEGFGRETTGSFTQFLRVAQGFLKELETFILLANRLEMIPAGDGRALEEGTTRIGKMLRAYIRSLMRRSGA